VHIQKRCTFSCVNSHSQKGMFGCERCDQLGCLSLPHQRKHAHDHCSTWVSGFKSSCSCFCMPPFLHCDRVSPKTQSVRDDAIDGWCGETEDPTSMCLSATTTRTWHWNISGQVRLISGPHFRHLGGCKIDLAETINGSKWTGSDRHTDQVN